MEVWAVYGGMTLCLFCLWVIARHDWLRLTRPSRKVMASVVRHRRSDSGDGISYAATYRFTDETGSHEVEDALHSSYRKPEVGELVNLVYPQGRPDLARPPRPLLWAVVYAALIYYLGILAAKALEFI